MPPRQFADEWLAPTVRELIGQEKLDELRGSDTAKDTLWETLVTFGIASDDQVLQALATRAGKEVVGMDF